MFTFNEGLAAVKEFSTGKKTTKWRFVDKKFEQAILYKYDKVNSFVEGLAYFNIVESANFMIYNGNHLFHYTSFSSVLKIIISGKLLFGEFKNMNNISESHREVIDPTLERLLHDYKSVSLTYDDSRKRAKLFDGNIGVLFYDVTTLYFEVDYEDDLSKTGFSKEGRHSNPQNILWPACKFGRLSACLLHP